MKMYTQFEKQYTDFLRQHLKSIDTTRVKASEYSATEYIRTFTTDHGTHLTPNLNKSQKCDDLARSHLHYGEELLSRGATHACLREVNEGIRVATEGDTLLRLLLLRIKTLVELGLCEVAKCEVDRLSSLFPGVYEISEKQLKANFLCNQMSVTEKECEKSSQSLASKYREAFKINFDPNKDSCFLEELEQVFRLVEEITSIKESSNYHAKRKQMVEEDKLNPLPYSDKGLQGYNNISPHVEIVESKAKGRHVIAKQAINIGDIIGVECPVVYTVLQEKWTRYCQFCLSHVRTLLPCPGCPDVVYCSVECWDRDAAEHSIICGFMTELSSLPAMTYLALRTALTFRNSILDMRPESPCCTTSSSDANFRKTVALVTNFGLRAPIDIIRRACLAIFLTNSLKAMKLARNVTKAKGVEKRFYENCVYLLFLVLQSYPCNAHEISELQLCEEFRYSANEDIGAGAFVFLSMLNHSCNPNVVRHSIGKKTVLRALRRIERGSELLDNYGYHYATHSPPERKKFLKSQYLFECQCKACAESWSLFINLPSSPTFKCRFCNVKTSALIVSCRKCGRKTGQTLQQYDAKADRVQSVVRQFVSDGCADNKHHDIIEFLQFCEEWTEPPFRLYNECQEVLKQMWNLRSNVNIYDADVTDK